MSWPNDRSRDGGVDRVPLPDGTPGALWLCGKHWIGPDWGRSERDIGADVVVCLCHRHEIADRYPNYAGWLANPPGPLRACWVPIHDLHAPTPVVAVEIADTVIGHLSAGRSVLMHCGAGIGRAGTLAAVVLMRLGLSRTEAVERVADSRPMAGPEVGAQSDLLEGLERQGPPIRSEGLDPAGTAEGG